MTMAETICCSLMNCHCDNFKPEKLKRRQCENCKHGWVAHAVSKLKVHHIYQCSQVEIVHSNVVFDICSLMLYGTQAIPIRLKILLDRLFSVLKQEEVIQILNALDWTLQDYIRGYVLQDVAGKVLDRWIIMTFEEEIATLQQFLRFGETKSIVELMALQDKEGQTVLIPSTRTNSDIRTFIERNIPRNAVNLSTSKVDKMSRNSTHHFETYINSIPFMVPFQLLGSVPTPCLGSSTGALQQQQQQYQQPCEASIEPHVAQEDQGRNGLGKNSVLSLSHQSESNLLLQSCSSISFTASLDQNEEKPMDISSTKTDCEDFSKSDNSGTLSMISDVAQMSPEIKLHSLDRNSSGNEEVLGGGGSLKKGRVFCNACEKTFYDKGTLKIHYNAVHLKIKHKCTIEGCNMVFSSLRSRNRHSANPNPRLHMSMNRNNRDKDLRHCLSTDENSQEEGRPEYSNPIPICSGESHKSVPNYTMSHVETSPKLHSSSFPSMGQNGILFPNLKTVQPVLPFYRSLVTPAELANTPGSLPSLPPLSSLVPVKPIAKPEPCLTELIPKKKSRKSSMPIKIEKEMVQQYEQKDVVNNSGEEVPSSYRENTKCMSNQPESYMCTSKSGEVKNAICYFNGKSNERKSTKNQMDQTLVNDGLEKKENDDELRQAEAGVIPCISFPFEKSSLEEHCGSHLLCQEPNGTEESVIGEHANLLPNKLSYLKWDEDYHRLTKGVGLCLLERGGLDGRLNDRGEDTDPPHHCEICTATFKSSNNVKMHNQNVHLKEMHICTMDGYNATFPTCRSRDRNDANMTKDLLSPASTVYSPSSHCTDKDSVDLDYCPVQWDRDLPQRDFTSQTPVIYRGCNRMGLVFPMSKMPTVTGTLEASTLVEMERLGGGEGGTNGDEGVALDLSTTASAPPCDNRSVQSSLDSDGAGNGEREGVEEDEEVLSMGDIDDSFDPIGMRRSRGGAITVEEERSMNCSGEGQSVLQASGGGSPMACHVCQKVYSNKGTFRAHYKTVHLRLLHKCKVPGCDTAFSSVRSRNRHSQNPNLHRNLSVDSDTTIDHL
ncbi:zinc finger protein basonuclin-1 [Cololabis saira]|uniref:zinc finger protein basonuclin-1 n=1 Tax=Cololabis saira TaxID=129043 RepID=UPI002AD4E4EF|nr:zinc finger protein basonuclin-1 [Cololabis saira]